MEHENHPIFEEHQHLDHHASHDRPPEALKLVAGSILAAGVLISASIFYSTRLLIKSLGTLPQQSAATGQQQGGSLAAAGPVSVKSRSDEPTVGNSNAKVTVVEFADFQCPYCQTFFKNTFPEIKKKYIDTGKIKYVFRHFPLSFHVNAEIASVAAECANRQDKFWQYHDLLFENAKGDGANLAAADLKKYADALGLNRGVLGFGKDSFNQCLEGEATLKTVQDDTGEGSKAGVSGTPSFFVNGQKIVGAQPFAVFEEAIEAALQK